MDDGILKTTRRWIMSWKGALIGHVSERCEEKRGSEFWKLSITGEVYLQVLAQSQQCRHRLGSEGKCGHGRGDGKNRKTKEQLNHLKTASLSFNEEIKKIKDTFSHGEISVTYNRIKGGINKLFEFSLYFFSVRNFSYFLKASSLPPSLPYFQEKP